MGVKYQQKCNSLLFFKFSHKLHLMGMNVLQGERVRMALFRVEANGNPLHSPDIVNSTLLVKIGKRNMAAVFVDFEGRNGSRHFLDQRKPMLRIFLVGEF